MEGAQFLRRDQAERQSRQSFPPRRRGGATSPNQRRKAVERTVPGTKAKGSSRTCCEACRATRRRRPPGNGQAPETRGLRGGGECRGSPSRQDLHIDFDRWSNAREVGKFFSSEVFSPFQQGTLRQGPQCRYPITFQQYPSHRNDNAFSELRERNRKSPTNKITTRRDL